MSGNIKVKIYVEGGGDAKSLKSEMRQAFQCFFKGWGLDGVLPSVVACGSRNEAFNDFKTAVKRQKDEEIILLLIDSEEYPTETSKWSHVAVRDHWKETEQFREEQLYFMAVCMESWFLSDPATLAKFYGQNFQANKLPKESPTKPIEKLSKETIYSSLRQATQSTQKGEYGKGSHSFKILAEVDAMKVASHGKYAKDLYDFLQETLRN